MPKLLHVVSSVSARMVENLRGKDDFFDVSYSLVVLLVVPFSEPGTSGKVCNLLLQQLIPSGSVGLGNRNGYYFIHSLPQL